MISNRAVMDGPGTIGKYLLIAGAVIAALGVIFIVLERLGIKIGRLPGDIYIRRDGWSFYFPLMTCILISLVLTLILWFFRRR